MSYSALSCIIIVTKTIPEKYHDERWSSRVIATQIMVSLLTLIVTVLPSYNICGQLSYHIR